jgi:hypothetical protein
MVLAGVSATSSGKGKATTLSMILSLDIQPTASETEGEWLASQRCSGKRAEWAMQRIILGKISNDHQHVLKQCKQADFAVKQCWLLCCLGQWQLRHCMMCYYRAQAESQYNGSISCMLQDNIVIYLLCSVQVSTRLPACQATFWTA